jgi:hypothetical protein
MRGPFISPSFRAPAKSGLTRRLILVIALPHGANGDFGYIEPFPTSVVGAVFEGEYGPGEVVGAAWAGANAVQDVPVLQGREAAFAAGA